MRLLIVAKLEGPISEAAQMAMKRGAKVAQTDTVDQALAALRGKQSADLVMVDVDLEVARLVKSLETERISTTVVACGVGTDAQAAVRAIRAGAQEYVPLPPNADLIAAILEAAVAEDHQIVSRDPAMAAVLKLADQVAPSDASVLITGESGTGKELMARYVHRKSKRKDKTFVSLNCAAIPDNLLESELFGHEKGAFTGAVARRIGKFEEADGGTLFLDEISEMDLRLQAKLLRAIQERVIDRVGGNKPIPVDIRIVATSNRNMEQSVRDGDFREDLYFRLNVLNLALPSLRERPQDIMLIAEHFVAKYSEANGLPVKPISAAAKAQLEAHHWRGNVRELENTMHRAVLLTTGDEIGPEAVMLSSSILAPADTQATALGQSAASVAAKSAADTPSTAPATTDEGGDAASGTGGLVGRTVAEVERDLILDTLSHTLGNRTHAANILGISIRTLRNKLKQYADDGVNIPAPGDADQVAG
ncbi:MAG: sigma-54-dependent Fis family transcriptional regulator [Alphaproteobacteria bacterium]|nr:sigma-54-dependent Fis family transcriptional regulator [Alphaproteobacteria bacterium SS10]